MVATGITIYSSLCGSDSYTKYIDLDECIFPGASMYHHIVGANCKNPEKNEDIECCEPNCGTKIWTLSLQSYTTRVHRPNAWEVPFNIMRDTPKEKLYLSLVAFPLNEECKILIHREGTHYTYR